MVLNWGLVPILLDIRAKSACIKPWYRSVILSYRFRRVSQQDFAIHPASLEISRPPGSACKTRKARARAVRRSRRPANWQKPPVESPFERTI